ncbi:hypothetical protein C8R43DRAFT_1127470 [Mycena crocata]|nr:hypothetical protein C8R43DRAFT_1127470 [Mycena crocata]
MPLTFFSHFAARLRHRSDRKIRTLAPPTTLHGPAAQLPSELVDLIMSMVDSSMLVHCSLVCSVWMAHTRSRMFHRIFLSASFNNVHRFVDLFKSPKRVTFGSSVREIMLDPNVAVLQYLWVDDLLPKLVATFANFNTLTITGMFPGSFDLHSAFPMVTRLEVRLSAKASLQSVTNLLSAFSHLETLVVRLPRQPGPVPVFPTGEGLLPHLRQVHIDNPYILRWMASFNPKPPIETLSFRLSGSETIPVALAAIRSVSSSLHSLDLRLLDSVAAAFLRIDRLHLRPQLRTLRLRAPYNQAGHILIKILSESDLDTSELTEIFVDFQISYVNRHALIPVRWGELHAMLSALPRLRRLTMTALVWNRYESPSGDNHRVILPGASKRLFSLSPDVVVTCVPEPRLHSRRAAGGGQLAKYSYY